MKTRSGLGYFRWTLPVLFCTLGLPACEKQAPPEPVAVELSMMSKCPFANPVLRTTLKALELLDESVALTISYLGQQREGRLFSIRGDTELTGDKLGLCAQDLAEGERQRRSFLSCLVADFEKIPNGWTTCAEVSGLPVDTLRDCFEGKRGNDLARASFEANAEQGITSSPTLRIGGKEYRGPRHSGAIARAVCEALGHRAKDACSKAPSAKAIPVTIVTDVRCHLDECSAQGLETVIAAAIPGARIERLDFNNPDAVALVRGIRFLPTAVIGQELSSDPEAMNLLGPSLLQAPTGRYVLPSGTRWDPRAEICGDGADNDGDAEVDCADDDCAYRMNCRPERKNSVTVFLDDGGEFSSRAVEALREIVEHTKRAASGFDVVVRQVGKQEKDGWVPLRGATVIADVKRQLCMQKVFQGANAVVDYLACRANQTQVETSWKACVTGVDEGKVLEVEACVDGQLGTELMNASFQESAQVPVQQTPHVLVNNKFTVGSYSPDAIATEVCVRNAGNTLCSFRSKSDSLSRSQKRGNE